MKKLIMGCLAIMMAMAVTGCNYSVDNHSVEQVDTNQSDVIVASFQVVGCDRLSGAGGELIVAKALLRSETLDSKSSVYVESLYFDTETVVVDNTADGDGVIIESTMIASENRTGAPRRAVLYLKALLDNGTTRLASVGCVQPALIDSNVSTTP